MTSFLKFIPLSIILMFVSSYLVKRATELQNADGNSTGRDDATANVLLALAPCLLLIDESGNENAFRKTLMTIRKTIDAYLTAGNATSDLDFKIIK